MTSDTYQSFKELNEKLTVAAKLLDEAAKLVKDLNLSPEKNIRKIGETLANIFEICHQIYRQYPELAPAILKDIFNKDEITE